MSSELTLWDQNGQPIFCLANDWLLNLQGNAVGFVERDGAVYDMRGRHVAWFSGGIVRDRAGYCIAFSEVIDDNYHPPLPAHHHPPAATTAVQPMFHPLTAVPSLPPLPRSLWSSLKPQEIFER